MEKNFINLIRKFYSGQFIPYYIDGVSCEVAEAAEHVEKRDKTKSRANNNRKVILSRLDSEKVKKHFGTLRGIKKQKITILKVCGI